MTMSGPSVARRILRVLSDPRTLPSKVRNRVDSLLNDSTGVRVVWPRSGRALLEPFRVSRPHGRQVLVLTHATLVSPGTERAMFAGLPNTSVGYPAYPGYSGSGEVILGGAETTGLAPGAHVAGPFQHASLQVLDEDQLVTVPPGVDLDLAAFIQLGVIAIQGVRKGRIGFGDHVAVLGSGLLGILAGQLARIAGAGRVTLVGGTAARLKLASDEGLATIDRRIAAASVAELEADVTIDATGNPVAIGDAVRATRRGGRIVLLGSNRGVTPGLDLAELRCEGLELVGAHITSLPPHDRAAARWPWRDEASLVLDLIAGQRLIVHTLLSHDVNPAEAERFYRVLSGDSTVLGAAFRWDQLDRRRRYTPGRDIVRERLRRAKPAAAVPAQPAAPVSVVASAPTRRLGMALIGCGEIALDNARAIDASPLAELRVAMDIDEGLARDMARRYGAEATAEVSAIWKRDDIDTVFISVPHHLHAPLTIEAARHGKHVIVEKPMATTVEEAEAMIDACRRAGVELGVCYAHRYLPYVQRAKSLIDRGAIGRLLGVHLVHLLDKPPSYWSRGRTGRVTSDWRRTRATSGGGVLVFNLVHYLDLIHYLTGLSVTEAFGVHTTADSPTETEDTISVSLRLGEDLVANVLGASCVRGATQQHQQLRIWGTEGHLNVAEPFQVYSLHDVDGLLPGAWHDLGEWEWGIERREYVTRFASAVFENRRPEVGGDEGLAVQRVVAAIYAAQTSGQAQRLGELERV